MLLTLNLPLINPYMTHGSIGPVHARIGDALGIGAKLLDLEVDLTAAAPHDCPPISHFRLTARDKVWLRRLDVAKGDQAAVGASLALFSTEPDEPLDVEPARALRVAIAGIISEAGWGEA